MSKSALILLSGGQDSATCLAIAKYLDKCDPIYVMSFDYGQRHKIELDCAEKLANLSGAKHICIPISSLKEVGGSALFTDKKIPVKHPMFESLPATFVPGRNYLFLGIAASFAALYGIKTLYTGVCETDYSGYPDCRDNSVKAVQVALSLCLGVDIIIKTPLMWKTKAETVLTMSELGVLYWYEQTHTCYNGQRPPCGECDACKLRAKGFQEAKIKDPLIYPALF